ncbi:sucrose-6-phosphate hydrolase [Mesorhizobium sp. M1312]|uniref:sucrose-6-phosphate hydrolase n=1 Tax=unclassified Mesorhizobium TaxID=325217 RepID=UPI0033356610
MAKPYAAEMEKLAETFAWSAAVDIAPLRKAVRTAGLSSLLAIGSGGSLTVAHALAGLHQRFTGRIAAVATPLDAVADPLEASVAPWLLSAGGGNVDILAATKALIAREPRQVGILCGREDSPLADLCRRHDYVDLLIYAPPAGKDGFLATNSLLGFTALLTRAYVTEFGRDADWDAIRETTWPLLAERSDTRDAWQATTMPLWSRQTTLVLYGPSTRIGAIDLESKFTEAALGNLQLADYRNFGHGRHHWLAKRGETSAVLAFVSEHDRALADRTLKLIPAEIPRAQLDLAGSASAAGLASLVAALRIAGWAGAARGIDPGRPGVPDFGRKLYSLPLPKPLPSNVHRSLTDRDAAAIARKAGVTPARLDALGELQHWRTALNLFRARLQSAIFGAVVLDYDGTIVDTRNRFDLARQDVTSELARILGFGCHLAIATGRGVSVRKDLRARLSADLWPRVVVGYYNGAEVATLDDDQAPDGKEGTCEALAPLAAALRVQPELAESAQQTDRRFQITLQGRRAMPENRLWDLAHQVILLSGGANMTVTRSSHSIDIVASGVSKLNVLTQLRERVGDGSILSIGDRGRWPGNDYALLKEPFALSVDEISVDPDTCWNLGKCGQRGVAVTLDYLRSLEAHPGGVRLRSGALQ